MTLTEYLTGIAYLAITVTALATLAVAVRRRFLATAAGALARLIEGVVALSTLVVVAEILGSFGALSAVSLLLALVATAVASRRLWRRAEVSAPLPGPRPAWRLPTLLALAAVAVTAAHWAGGVQDSLDFGIYRQDSTWYHLPLAAALFQGGDTWAVHFTDPMALVAWFYPQNSELVHAVGMLGLGTDFLSVFVNLGWLGLAFLAAWCAGGPAGLRAEAVLATAVVLGTEMMQAQAGNAPNDIAGIALLLSSAAILLNARRLGGSASGDGWRPPPAALFVAALAAGLAVGTKITLLAPVGVISVGLLWLLRRERARLPALWCGGVLLGGGYWYLRNWAHAGNPLPWLAVGPLPGPDQVGLYPRAPHSVADYVGHPSVWVHGFAPALADAIGPLWPVVLVAAAVGLLSATVRGPGLERVLGLSGLAAAIAYVFIPVSASGAAGHPAGFGSNLRYLVPALSLGLVLLVVRSGTGPRGRRLLAPALAAVFAIDSLSHWGWWPQSPGVGMALALLLVAVPLAFAVGGRLVPVGFAAVVVLVACGYPGERDYLRSRYRAWPVPAADSPGFRDTPQWRRLQAWGQGVHDAKIGVVGPPGAFGQYAFVDSHLTNRVTYLGEPGPHGSYRPIDDCIAWRRAIDRARLDYVVVTPAVSFGAHSEPEERVWLADEPRAHQVLAAPPAAVYAIRGPLDPGGCRTGRLPPLLAVPGGGVAIPPGVAAPAQ